MAFIQDTVALGLIRDSYPQKIARNISEPLEWSDMPREMYMPGEFDALFEWVKLQEIPHSADPTRKFDVVHVPRPFSELSLRSPSLQRMTIRIFGVLGNLNLMDLGNWDRTEGGVPKAIQFVSLLAGPFQHQFAVQQNALANIKKMVFRLLGEHEPSSSYKPEQMFFFRRAFSKVDGYSFQRPLMSTADSDETRLASICNRWIPSPPAPYGRKLDNGSIKRTSHAVFNRGDFVDVTAAIEIASIGRSIRGRKTDVHFTFTRIVRLCTADELTTLLGQGIPDIVDEPIIQEQKLDFEGEEADVVLA